VVKVFKSVGAVRVYNPWNAAWAVLGIALLIAGIGFGIGWVAHNDSGGSTDSSAAVSDAAGRQAAYQSGLAAARRQVARVSKAPAAAPATRTRTVVKTSGSFKAGTAYAFGGISGTGAYFVEVGKGKQGLRIGPHVSAQPGNTYWVCGGGSRICYRAGTP
jgi:hypothetical protein